jgi:hypothetical protein
MGHSAGRTGELEFPFRFEDLSRAACAQRAQCKGLCSRSQLSLVARSVLRSIGSECFVLGESARRGRLKQIQPRRHLSDRCEGLCVENLWAMALGRAEVLRHILWREAAFAIGRYGLRFEGGRETAFACFGAWQ